MVKQTPAEKYSFGKGIAVALPVTTSTLLRAKRVLKDCANTGSSSRAVRWAIDERKKSVVKPGPGPSSSTRGPRSRPAMAQGTRRCTVLRQ